MVHGHQRRPKVNSWWVGGLVGGWGLVRVQTRGVPLPPFWDPRLLSPQPVRVGNLLKLNMSDMYAIQADATDNRFILPSSPQSSQGRGHSSASSECSDPGLGQPPAPRSPSTTTLGSYLPLEHEVTRLSTYYSFKGGCWRPAPPHMHSSAQPHTNRYA